jgi:hypothetical protein
MLQRLVGQLPDWARASHPLVRYELDMVKLNHRRGRYLRALGFAFLIVLLYVGGYLIATNVFQNPPGQNLSEIAMAIVFWPTLGLQLLMQMAALALTVNMVTEQKRRQSWDNLRATEGGAGLALRARWATVYYRLRPLIAVVILVRLGLIIAVLIDLTAFQGHYIDLLMNGVAPNLPPLIAALLLAFLMTAALLIPLTGTGLLAAIGLLISVNVQQRVYSVMLQLIVILVRLLLVAGLILGATQFITGDWQISDLGAWLLMGGFGAFGDWGLKFLHLGFYSEVWATVPYSVFFGVVLLIFVLLQSAITEWLLGLAIRRAEQIG